METRQYETHEKYTSPSFRRKPESRRLRNDWIPSSKRFFLIALAATLVLAAAVGADAAIQPGARYERGNLTLEAKKATVGELLEAISRTAGVDVFIAKGLQIRTDVLTLKIEGEPLEDAVKRILAGYNYAAIYEKEGNDFRIAALNIYPENRTSGAVEQLFTGGRTPLYEEKTRRGETVTVLVNSLGEEMITHGAIARKGLLVPSQSAPNPSNDPEMTLRQPWVALQLQLENEEAAKFKELLFLQKRIEGARDPELKKSLALIYADETAKFYDTKRANLNKIESMKRITQFRDMTGQ